MHTFLLTNLSTNQEKTGLHTPKNKRDINNLRTWRLDKREKLKLLLKIIPPITLLRILFKKKMIPYD